MKMNKPNEVMKEKWLYGKYQIINTETGKEVEGFYFVLKPETDYAALRALETYSQYTTNLELAKDLNRLMWELSPVHLIISGDYYQYRNYLFERGIPHTNKKYRYVRREEELRGLGKNVVVIMTGQYWKNPLYKSPELETLQKFYQWRVIHE